MTYTTISLEMTPPLAILRLNRPGKLNAINADMLREMENALDAVENDERVYALVLCGEGRAFCAGFDLDAGMAANRTTEAEWRAAIEYDLKVIMRFWHCPKPTVAVTQGYALAGGFELALAWYTNPKRSKKMLLTGQDRMPAEEALAHGIVNEIVPAGNGLERGLALARECALLDPDSVRMTKQAINRTYETMGMYRALQQGANTSVEIETLVTPLREAFNRILKEQGLKAALAWREQRLGTASDD